MKAMKAMKAVKGKGKGKCKAMNGKAMKTLTAMKGKGKCKAMNGKAMKAMKAMKGKGKGDELMEHDDDDANLVGLVCNWCGEWSWGREPSQIPRLAEWQLMHNPPGSDRPGWLVTNDTDYSLQFVCSLVRNLMSVRMRVLYHLMILVVGHSARIFIHVPTACDTARPKQTFHYKTYKDIKP